MARRVVAWALLLLLSACTDDPAMLIVVVESDLAIPEPLADVRAVVNGEGEHTFSLAAPDPNERVSIPFSFVVAPRDGDASRQVHLVLEGRREDGTVIVTREVQTSFVPRTSKLLRVVLSASCVDIECTAGLTCIAGGCDSRDVDPMSLPDVEPGTELVDAGAIDGGAIDGGAVDGGAIDGGAIDSGTIDSGVIDGGGTLPACSALPAGSASGVYTIDPDGAGPIAPFDVYCETSEDDGGWTLLAKVTPDGVLGFGAAAWTSPEPMPLGTNDLAYADALSRAYWHVPVTTLRIALADTNGARQWAITELDGTGAAPLRDIVTAGTATFRTSASALRTMLQVSVNVPTACESGVNASLGTFQVRLGVVAGRTSACDQLHGWFGIGATTAAGCETSTSSIASGSARLCGAPGQRGETPRVGIVMGR
ncbi:fibrinogen-like YCDxxxxGGGW domain-containing protein [Sandaracinus amylolyticus]|uniref:fibrinogen-like YCDxxxxGGGW domain-containing protein n=1 Tax=Sandaracinus amylolyticus TaxID=927083 RepID=UPI001F429CFD|nr:fibrinogen-like YCDxxxxGGGW domain-containing protein [Sandaracinus amylolyticus]UJR85531.1 Hypothetical protein I5071_76110 [Sandaracinus amylolyticus]